MLFMSSKSDLIYFVEQAHTFMSSRKTPIQSLQMDNAGENQAIETFYSQNDIVVKHTPPDTSKLNIIIERAFVVIQLI